MKTHIFFLCTLLLLSSCGGSGGGSGNSVPDPVPIGTISGVTFDGQLIQGTISAYDYSGGTRGSLLDSDSIGNDGSYSLSIQSHDTPVLLVVTGARYLEESSGVSVLFTPTQFLSSVFLYTLGDNITVQVSPFTHLAAGLADYRIINGATVNNAITTANNDVSSLLNLNIIDVAPLDITNAFNSSLFITDGHEYGFLSAAISSLTEFISTYNGVSTHSVYNSIAFSQIMYDDIKADGVLDGLSNMLLSMGSYLIDIDVYRYGIPGHIIKMVNNVTRNKTALDENDLLQYAQDFANTDHSLWGGSVPAFTDGRPGLTINFPASNSWHNSTINFDTAPADNYDAFSVSVYVDGNFSNSIGDPLVGDFSIDTSIYADGMKAMSYKVTNVLGLEHTIVQNVGFDNTPPVLVSSTYLAISDLFETVTPNTLDKPFWQSTGVITDSMSGVSHITHCWSATYTINNVNGEFLNSGTGAWKKIIYYGDMFNYANGTAFSLLGQPLWIVDNAGNYSSYQSAVDGGGTGTNVYWKDGFTNVLGGTYCPSYSDPGGAIP